MRATLSSTIVAGGVSSSPEPPQISSRAAAPARERKRPAGARDLGPAREGLRAGGERGRGGGGGGGGDPLGADW
jgi:hypothetical protein